MVGSLPIMRAILAQSQALLLNRREVMAGAAATAMVLPTLAQTATAAETLVDDASHMNQTAVFSHWITKPPDRDILIDRLRRELKDAKAAGRPVAIAGARHSMGGQSIPKDGHAIQLNIPDLEIDRAGKRYHTGAGARWDQVVAALDPMGLSPLIMQSNDDFAVGSTLCVNAHGWPIPYGPFGDSVRSFRLMLADGEIVTCSPTENAELFQAAIGGYGLLGIVLDLELDAAENALLEAQAQVMPAEQFGAALQAAARSGGKVEMAYGRLSLSRENFLREALLVTYGRKPGAGTPPAATVGGFISNVSRHVFRAQIGSDFWKRQRWTIERRFKPGTDTRNTLLNEPVSSLGPAGQGRTDILHEYFVPPERFADFMAACRRHIPGSGQDLLNVTLRYLAPDRRSLLAYAPDERVAAVMLFSQTRDADGDAAMARMTRALIDEVLAIGGCYYLPYRLHATAEQMHRAYPGLDRFLALKRQHDPGLLFRNRLWDHYLAAA